MTILGVLVLCFTLVGTFSEEVPKHSHLFHHNHRSHGEVHEKHHHFVRKYKLMNTSQPIPATSTAVPANDNELATIAKWLNNTRELDLLFQIIPPSVKGSVTQTENCSMPMNLNQLYDATVDWPIVTYFAKLIGAVLSKTHGIMQLFSMYPELVNIWKIILNGLRGGCSNPESLTDNLKEFFGYNGTFGGNLFNLTYWEHVWNPSGIIRGFEHAVEGGLETLANLRSI